MTPNEVQHLPGLSLPVVRLDGHACPYLPGRVESDLVVLSSSVDSNLYQSLMDRGFRRSGPIFYRPDCDGCRACEPIRIPVARFSPSRSQKRVMRRNKDVTFDVATPTCDGERFELYERYQAAQHDRPATGDTDDYRDAFCDSPIDTFEMSYRVDGRLVGVGIVDATPVALSSVYFYFEPSLGRRSLGTYSALCEIAKCRELGLPYWYVGYHVRGCAKMEYKARFRPHELLDRDGIWREGSPHSTSRGGP